MSAPARPEVQLLGDTVLLSGLALADARALIQRGISQTRRDGIAPHPRLTSLMAALESAIQAGSMSDVGHADVRRETDLPPSGTAIGITEAAAVLGLSTRQVRRIATSLGGRRSSTGTWFLDPLEVNAYREGRA